MAVTGDDDDTGNFLNMYQRVKAEDQSEHIYTVMANMGVVFDRKSPLFQSVVRQWLQTDLKITARGIKKHKVLVAENLNDEDLEEFEEALFSNNSDKKRPRPTLRISEVWAKYRDEVLSASKTKRLQEEIDRHQNYVDAFIDFNGDQPLNYVTRVQVNDFFNALSKRPAKLNVPERSMTFSEIIAQDIPATRELITKKGAIEWYSRLSRIFKYGFTLFRDQFEIQNPFEDMKANVRGAEGTAKRDWYKDEVAALFAQKEFTDAAKRDSFFFSVLCALRA